MDGDERDDAGDSSSEDQQAGSEGLSGRGGEKASDRRSWGEVESPSGRHESLSEAIAGGTKDSDRLKFVVSSMTLEAEVGVIKRSLTEYNQRWDRRRREFVNSIS